jgi:translocator protein
MISRSHRRTKSSFGHLVALILLCLAVAGVASVITMPAVRGWYQTLVHPSFTPPDAVFGPVWTTLYIMMAVAAWRAWGVDGHQWSSLSIRLFLVQLILNFAWSFIFFGGHLLGIAAVEIVILEITIIAMTWVFLMRDRIAALLMLPYIAWVGFASALNIAFWQLN